MKGVVLVVDDERIVRESLCDILELEGYAVHVACDGESALRKLEDVPVDLVITDIMMPGMDGISLLRAIRATDSTIPVIIITGNPTQDTTLEALREGASDYIAKPFSSREVLASTARALLKTRLLADEARWKSDATALLQSPNCTDSTAAAVQTVMTWTHTPVTVGEAAAFLEERWKELAGAEACSVYVWSLDDKPILLGDGGLPLSQAQAQQAFEVQGPHPAEPSRRRASAWIVPLVLLGTRVGLLVVRFSNAVEWPFGPEASSILSRRSAAVLAHARLIDTPLHR